MNSKIRQEEMNNVAWKACDSFRRVLPSAVYKDYILAFLFLKYLSDVWKDKKEKYSKEYKNDKVRVKRKMERESFVLPEDSSFDYIFSKRSESNIGELINIAFANIEESNKGKLDGVMDVDFNSDRLGETKDRNKILKNFIEDFADPQLDLSPSRVGNLDIIGKIGRAHV